MSFNTVSHVTRLVFKIKFLQSTWLKQWHIRKAFSSLKCIERIKIVSQLASTWPYKTISSFIFNYLQTGNKFLASTMLYQAWLLQIKIPYKEVLNSNILKVHYSRDCYSLGVYMAMNTMEILVAVYQRSGTLPYLEWGHTYACYRHSWHFCTAILLRRYFCKSIGICRCFKVSR